MPTALHSFIQENGRVIVQHTFFGKTEAEAAKWKAHQLPQPDVEDLELYLFGEDDYDDEDEEPEDEEADEEEADDEEP